MLVVGKIKIRRLFMVMVVMMDILVNVVMVQEAVEAAAVQYCLLVLVVEKVLVFIINK